MFFQLAIGEDDVHIVGENPADADTKMEEEMMSGRSGMVPAEGLVGAQAFRGHRPATSATDADPSLLRRLHPIARLMTRYFDGEVFGLDRIPAGAALLVGNHNAGLLSPEVYLFGFAYLEHTDYRDPPVVLAHDMFFRVPWLGPWIRRLGAVPASQKVAREMLARGRKVLVYPGGDWEATRPSRDRDLIDFGGRLGFLRLAWQSQVPIVPVVAAGAHDGWYVLTRGEKFARSLHVPRLFRAGVLPITLSLPWGVSFGAVLPHLPLPHKILIEVLPALAITGDPQSDTDLKRGYDEVTGKMQAALDRLVRRLPRRRVGATR